jgi:hypothetical protein
MFRFSSLIEAALKLTQINLNIRNTKDITKYILCKISLIGLNVLNSCANKKYKLPKKDIRTK